MAKWLLFLMLSVLVAGFAVAAQAERTEVIFDETFDVGAGWELDMDVGDMDVEITPGDSDEARVVVTLKGNLDKARDRFDDLDFDARVKGQTLVVETRERRMWSTSWWGTSHWSIHVAVTVPQKFDLSIQTSDGDIDVDGVDGDISLTTSDGDVRLGELKGPAIFVRSSDGDLTADALLADEVELKTSDGDVRTERIEGRSVILSTSDGDVTARGVRADEVSVRSSDGNLDLHLTGGELRGKTSDGDIDVWIDNDTAVDLSTSDGDITIHAPADLGAELDLKGEDVRLGGKVVLEGDISDDRVRGRIGDGGKRVRARTSDGSVSLRFI